MRISRLIASVMIVVLVADTLTFAGSIWARARRCKYEIYTDDTARNMGDNLTIIISEHSVIANTRTRANSKESDRQLETTANTFDLGNLVTSWTNKSFITPSVNIAGNTSHSLDTQGTYDADRSVTDRITVTVEDVLPNGNLVVLGSRTRMIAGDSEIIQVSGIVRPSDIAYANTINSNQVANFHLVYTSAGPEKRVVNPNWLGRIFNYFWPE